MNTKFFSLERQGACGQLVIDVKKRESNSVAKCSSDIEDLSPARNNKASSSTSSTSTATSAPLYNIARRRLVETASTNNNANSNSNDNNNDNDATVVAKQTRQRRVLVKPKLRSVCCSMSRLCLIFSVRFLFIALFCYLCVDRCLGLCHTIRKY